MIARGTRIDRYEVIEHLGSGGMGAVYRARHVGLGQDVALKLLSPERAHDAEAVQRFLREAKAAAAIRSPHVVEVTDFGVSGEGLPFLVMELVVGSDLDSHLERRGRLGSDDAVGIALDVLAGLQAAHSLGIVHRDLKAGNILLAGDVVKLADFGLAKVAGPPVDGLTRTGTALGTPAAMSPEQARGDKDVDARSDLWGVGVLLYRALAGRPPFEGTSAEDVMVRICTESPPPLDQIAPAVPAPLAAVVMRALERAPAARWQSAGEMSVALRQAMRAADAALDAPRADGAAAADDDEDAQDALEQQRADALGPGPRPSLAFSDVRPRNAWKLPLALGGFVAGAGGLIVLALVLRPTAPAAVSPPAPAPPMRAGGAPLPSYDEVAGVVVSVAPGPSVVSAGTPKVDEADRDPASVVHVRVVEAHGPLELLDVEERLGRAARMLMPYRADQVVREQASGTIHPNGALIVEGGAPLFGVLTQTIRFPVAERPTRVRLEVVLDAIAPPSRTSTAE